MIKLIHSNLMKYMLVVAVLTGSLTITNGEVRASTSINLVKESLEVTTSSSVEAWGFSRASLLQEDKVQPGWSSASNIYENHTEWFSIDLEALYALDHIELYPRRDGGNIGEGFPIDFTIQASTNGLQWTTVKSVSGYAKPDEAAQIFDFDEVTARYVKVEATNLRTVEGSYRMQLSLVKVYGDPSPIVDSESPLTTQLDSSRLLEVGTTTLQQPNLTVEWQGLYRKQWTFYDLFGRRSILDTPAYLMGAWTPEHEGDYQFALISAMSSSAHPDDPTHIVYYETLSQAGHESATVAEGEQDGRPAQDIRYRKQIDGVVTIDGMLTAPIQWEKGVQSLLTFQTDYIRMLSNLASPLEGSYLNSLYVGVFREGSTTYETLIPLVPIENYSADSVNLRLYSPTVGGVYTDKEEIGLNLQVFNAGAEAQIEVEYEITAVGEESSIQHGTAMNAWVPALSEQTVQIRPNPLPFGVYLVDVKVGNASARTRLAIVPEQDLNAVEDSGITFGMNTFWRQIPWQAYQIPLTAKAGMKWIRPWLDGENIWATQEPEPDIYNWAPLDTTLAMLQPYGLGYYNIMAFAPDWAKRSTGWAPRLDRMEDFATYIGDFFDRYKNTIPYVTAWNEPNGPEFWDKSQTAMESLPEYIDLVDIFVNAAKHAGGSIKLVGPSLGAPVNDDDSEYWGPFQQWFEEFGKSGYFADFDEIDIHPYDHRRLGIGPEKSLSSGSYDEQLDQLWRILQSAPGGSDKKFALTEVAYPALDDEQFAANEVLQAQLMQRQYLMSVGTGYVDKVFWFSFLDPLSNQTNALAVDASNGMFYNGYVPKLVYAAQAGMSSLLNNATGLGRIQTDPGTWGFAFKKGSQSIIALWRESNVSSMLMNYPVQSDTVKIADMFGNVEEVAVSDRVVSVNVTQSPIYIITDNAYSDLEIKESGLPEANTLSEYSTVVQAAGGVLPYTWSASGLPAGLSIDPVTGELYGKPESAGETIVHLTVQDGTYATVDKFLKLIIHENTSVNLALGRSVTVSSSVEGWGFAKANLVDGNTTDNGWSSDSELGTSHTEWVNVDLNAEYMIDRVKLYPRLNHEQSESLGFPIDFNIQVSEDGIEWTTVASRAAYGQPGVGGETLIFDAIKARYVKVEGTELMNVEGSYRLQLAELQVYGSPNSEVELGLWSSYTRTGMVAVPYSYNIQAVGGVRPYSWSATGLPAGLGIHPETGEIFGIPKEGGAGTSTVRFTVTDGLNRTASRDLMVVIDEAVFANQALNKEVAASSSVEGWGFSKESVVDGQPTGNGWSSDSNLGEDHTEWISVDLGADYMLSRIHLYPRNSNSQDAGLGFPIDFNIQVSRDGVNWEEMVEQVGYERPGAGAQTFEFDEIRARYVKVEGTSLMNVEGSYRMQIAELQAVGYAAPPEEPAETYKVIYNGNGNTSGSAPIDSNAYEQGSTITVLANMNSLDRSGFVLTGWNTAADGSGTDYGPGDIIVMGTTSVTLYAKWTSVGSSSADQAQESSITNARQAVVVFGDEDVDVAIDIVRTQGADGKRIDTLEMGAEIMAEAVNKAVAANQKKVRVVIADMQTDNADEYVIKIPKSVALLLMNQGITLELQTNNVRITLPQEREDNWSEIGSELSYRIVPIRPSADQDKVVQNMLDSLVLQGKALAGEARMIGQQVKIETTYSGLQTRVMFRIEDSMLPADEDERERFLASLAVFVQHNDGNETLQSTRIIYDDKGEPSGVEIDINTFSIFSIVSLPQAANVQFDRYVNGYEDGTFRPSKEVTRAELAAMIGRNLSSQAARNNNQVDWSDVPREHWALSYIEQVHEAGIMTGRSLNRFSPDAVVSRAELALALVRWKEISFSSEAEATGEYEGHWAANAIEAVRSSGWMNGYPDGSFRPDKGVNRAEVVRALNAALNRKLMDTTMEIMNPPIWSDVPNNHWAWRDIISATHSYSVTMQADDTE